MFYLIRIVVFASFLSFCSGQLKASSDLGWETKLGQSVLRERCLHYFSNHPRNAWECSVYSDRLVQLLSPRFDLSNGAFVVFGDELLELLNDTRVIAYLSYLAHEMPAGASLFDVTNQFAGGSKYVALKWLAVLFQDTSRARRHIKYLKSHYDSNLGPQIDQLECAINRLSVGDLQYYPVGSSDLNRTSLYHFYVSGFLAYRLDMGDQKRLPFRYIAPLMMNSHYEILFYYCDFALKGVKKVLETLRRGESLLCWNVSSFDYSQNNSWIDDNYMAYSGAVWALNLFNPFTSFTFGLNYSFNNKEFLRQLLQQ